MIAHCPNVGLVVIDINAAWIGGRYYLHHLVRAVSLLPHDERTPLLDVSWGKKPKTDPFLEGESSSPVPA